MTEPDKTLPEHCKSFPTCNAPLCPLEPDLLDHVWYADEPVCNSRKYGVHRWIKKQRSIQKRKTKSWLDKPISWRMIYDASRPRELSEEAKQKLKDRMRKIRAKIAT